MKKKPKIPFQILAKKQMSEDVTKIISHLHHGERPQSDLLIEDLKSQAAHFSENIQQDVLMFSEQIQFQYDYDPWHKITPDVQAAADRLIKDLGLTPPPPIQFPVF